MWSNTTTSKFSAQDFVLKWFWSTVQKNALSRHGWWCWNATRFCELQSRLFCSDFSCSLRMHHTYICNYLYHRHLQVILFRQRHTYTNTHICPPNTQFEEPLSSMVLVSTTFIIKCKPLVSLFCCQLKATLHFNIKIPLNIDENDLAIIK